MLVGLLLSGSIVWAFALVSSRDAAERFVPIFDEGFEDPAITPGRNFPTKADVWSGNLSPSVATQDGVSPLAGEHMMRLAPHSKRKFSYAQRIVDLAELPLAAGGASVHKNTLLRVEVEASFHAPPGSAIRYQIHLAALAEQPEEVKAIWGGGELFDYTRQHVGRTVTTKPNATNSNGAGWQTLTTTMDIPEGTRSLVFSLAAATPDDAAPKSDFYLDLDEVRARFVIQ